MIQERELVRSTLAMFHEVQPVGLHRESLMWLGRHLAEVARKAHGHEHPEERCAVQEAIWRAIGIVYQGPAAPVLKKCVRRLAVAKT